MFAALDIKNKAGFLGKIRIYTYGQPRVGNAQFSDYITQIFPHDYYRVIHFTDPIPDLPSMFFGYKHAGTEIWYYSPLNSDSSFKECTNKINE
jgi:predicted lipase